MDPDVDFVSFIVFLHVEKLIADIDTVSVDRSVARLGLNDVV